uniref:DNA2/NAM7 helicase-like C-terminal domain-containing protein n=1 Tax=Meloidogyne enterolobii TaxID=390850 RepID=A0A6V7TJ96_MELEN|nr:unnamed protein product [Meloidogyne enterolobii]
MIGDNHQLPPIVQNVAYQKYSNMEQSLFARLIRLGVPHIQLNCQGRARSELANLYNWRYKNLGDLKHVLDNEEFKLTNAGFLYNYQLINVPDFNGIGESTPSAYFYQNLGEAEFAVALYVYMRILGYPSEKISILTTYNGQASLLRDIINKRCTNNPLIGMPGKISTVDKYQGQQNDYIILSLVRTKAVGHLRDVRRLVVALSRARLGLYILCRVSLFKKCYELAPAFERLLQKPTRLLLLPTEQFGYPNENRQKQPLEIIDTQHMSHFVSEFYSANIEIMKGRNNELEKEQEEEVMEVVVTTEETSTTTTIPVVEIPKETEGEEEERMEVGEVREEEKEKEDKNKEDGPKESDEGAIVFEQVDFERLQNVPKYG